MAMYTIHYFPAVRRATAAALLGALIGLIGAAPGAAAQSVPQPIIKKDQVNLVEGVPRGLPIPGWYPSYFERAGIFHGFTEDGQAAMIDARRYLLGPGFTVSTLGSQDAPKASLEGGAAVGITLARMADGRLVVERLWALPDGLVNSDGDRHGLVVK